MPVDSICVVKHAREMYVFNNRRLLKVYHISLGTSPTGAKHFEGDRKTPEGLYHIYDKNPNSMAHKNLGISYPNDNDRSYALRHRRATGGSIKIHGMVNGYEQVEQEYRNTDWTWGCIAVMNKDIDELYDYVAIGSPIWIKP
jgi:murein L,D-transpeptidase YafK